MPLHGAPLDYYPMGIRIRIVVAWCKSLRSSVSKMV